MPYTSKWRIVAIENIRRSVSGSHYNVTQSLFRRGEWVLATEWLHSCVVDRGHSGGEARIEHIDQLILSKCRRGSLLSDWNASRLCSAAPASTPAVSRPGVMVR